MIVFVASGAVDPYCAASLLRGSGQLRATRLAHDLVDRQMRETLGEEQLLQLIQTPPPAGPSTCAADDGAARAAADAEPASTHPTRHITATPRSPQHVATLLVKESTRC